MDANLFTAYNYLSSAIAQAFAALIALTAMFYIYRKQTLGKKIEELIEHLRGLITTSHGPVWIETKQFPEYKVIEEANKRIEEGRSTRIPEIKHSVTHYEQLKTQQAGFKSRIYWPIFLSALTMGFGIGALLFGWWVEGISPVGLLVIMIFESLLAAVALGWTVAVVIKMLGDRHQDAGRA
jgi:uncharacterized membrane protein